MITEVDGAGVRELLADADRGVVIDFWSPWCAPCRTLRPHLDAMSREREDDWLFVAVNTEDYPATADEFGIASLPTIVWFRDGEELSRVAGVVTLASIAERFDELA